MAQGATPNMEVINLKFENMTKRFEENKADTDKRFDRIEMLIRDGLLDIKNNYSTKKDTEDNTKRLDWIDSIIFKVIGGIVIGFITIVTGLIGLSKYY